MNAYSKYYEMVSITQSKRRNNHYKYICKLSPCYDILSSQIVWLQNIFLKLLTFNLGSIYTKRGTTLPQDYTTNTNENYWKFCFLCADKDCFTEFYIKEEYTQIFITLEYKNIEN